MKNQPLTYAESFFWQNMRRYRYTRFQKHWLHCKRTTGKHNNYCPIFKTTCENTNAMTWFSLYMLSFKNAKLGGIFRLTRAMFPSSLHIFNSSSVAYYEINFQIIFPQERMILWLWKNQLFSIPCVVNISTFEFSPRNTSKYFKWIWINVSSNKPENLFSVVRSPLARMRKFWKHVKAFIGPKVRNNSIWLLRLVLILSTPPLYLLVFHSNIRYSARNFILGRTSFVLDFRGISIRTRALSFSFTNSKS